MRLLKKKSINPAVWDYFNSGEKEIKYITNLDKCEDGVYELDIYNISYDIESWYADDWDYILKPYEES